MSPLLVPDPATAGSPDTGRSRLVRSLGLLILVGTVLTASATDPVRAQSGAPASAPADTVSSEEQPHLGVGVHAGWPTGLGLLLGRPGADVDLLAAWRLKTFFFGHAHVRLWEGPIPLALPVGYYGGPGVSVHARDGQFRVGGSGVVGARYRYDPFEFFLQVTPRLELVPELRFGGTIGAGLYVLI